MIRAKKEIKITKRDIARAASNALRGHRGKREVEDFKTHFADRVEELWQWWESGEWRHRLAYRQLEKTNANGKRRKINSPDLTTRIYQHLFILKVLPLYIRRDNGHRKNCKRGFGITASDKRKSVVSRVKHAFYDRRDCGYIVKIDQRKCYAHIRPTVFANELRRLTTDARFVRFATAICFVDGELPIGTPSSPVAHHITMLRFDHFKTEVCEYGVAYADDDLLFCRTREEAHAALWRCRFFLWYELGIRLKRGAVVQPTAKATDFCGYVFRRREPKRSGHGKGFTRLRRTTFRRVCKATRRSYPAYFGLLRAADSYAAMRRIEKTMRLQQLTEKIRIDRKLDARNIDVKEIAGRTITVIDYDIRRDGKGNANWIKLLIGIPEHTADGELTGRTLAREFHGNYAGLYNYLEAVERQYKKKEILPIEEAVIVNQCGYIFEGSTNQIEYINI